MASLRLYALVSLLLLLQAPVLNAHSAHPPPDAATVLTRGKRFSTLIKLLSAANLVPAANSLSTNTSGAGVTIFAPTDAAFAKIPAAVLNNLTQAQTTQILLLHVVAKYYDDATLPNPVPTLSTGKSLNIVKKQKKLFVSSGKVTTRLNCPLYQKFPLSVYAIADVLLP
ncbi:fasciclin-like arabinogalactan protein 6 [Wolffia australiana]